MGTLLQVVPRKRFEYSHLAGGATQTVTLAAAVDVLNFYYVHVFVRVHTRNMSGGQSFKVGAYYTMPSCDDAREFTDVTAITELSITSAVPSAVSGIVHREFSGPGGYLKFLLTAAQSPTSPTTLYAELSVALVLRAH